MRTVSENRAFVYQGVGSAAINPAVCVRNITDYSPFGVSLDGRTISLDNYRYGYQGSEKDDETKGSGNSYTTFFRQLDPRVGRWFSVDPVFQPWQSPYCSMDDSPTRFADQRGDVIVDKNGNEVKIVTETTSDHRTVLSFEFDPSLSFEKRVEFVHNQGEILTAMAQTDKGFEKLTYLIVVETKVSISKLDVTKKEHLESSKKLGTTSTKGIRFSKMFSGLVPREAEIIINMDFIEKLVNNSTNEEKDANGNIIEGSNNRFNFVNKEEGTGTVASHETDHIKNRFSFDLGRVWKGGNHKVKSGIPATEIDFMTQYRNKKFNCWIPEERIDPTKHDVFNSANKRLEK